MHVLIQQIVLLLCTGTLSLFQMLFYKPLNLIVTQPLYESRMNWIHDPAPPPPRRTDMDYSDTPVQSSDTPVQSR